MPELRNYILYLLHYPGSTTARSGVGLHREGLNSFLSLTSTFHRRFIYVGLSSLVTILTMVGDLIPNSRAVVPLDMAPSRIRDGFSLFKTLPRLKQSMKHAWMISPNLYTISQSPTSHLITVKPSKKTANTQFASLRR